MIIFLTAQFVTLILAGIIIIRYQRAIYVKQKIIDSIIYAARGHGVSPGVYVGKGPTLRQLAFSFKKLTPSVWVQPIIKQMALDKQNTINKF